MEKSNVFCRLIFCRLTVEPVSFWGANRLIFKIESKQTEQIPKLLNGKSIQMNNQLIPSKHTHIETICESNNKTNKKHIQKFDRQNRVQTI